jgi:hypothetical protein
MKILITALLFLFQFYSFSQSEINPIYKEVMTSYLNFLTTDSVLKKTDKLIIDNISVYSSKLKDNPNFILTDNIGDYFDENKRKSFFIWK